MRLHRHPLLRDDAHDVHNGASKLTRPTSSFPVELLERIAVERLQPLRIRSRGVQHLVDVPRNPLPLLSLYPQARSFVMQSTTTSGPLAPERRPHHLVRSVRTGSAPANHLVDIRTPLRAPRRFHVLQRRLRGILRHPQRLLRRLRDRKFPNVLQMRPKGDISRQPVLRVFQGVDQTSPPS